MFKRLIIFLIHVLLAFPLSGFAHTPSSSYLFVSNEKSLGASLGNSLGGSQKSHSDNIQLQWDIALRDLEHVLGLDTNIDHQITWREVQEKQTEIIAYAYSNLDVQRNDKSCHLSKIKDMQINRHSDGNYVTLHIQPQCEASKGTFTISYSLLFLEDPNHRGIILDQRYQQDETTSNSFIASPENRRINLDQNKSLLQNLITFVQQGIWHIWIGLDHILFIITLMLPAVLLYKNKQWTEVTDFKPALISLFKVVTAFTVAHSITLSLATLEVVTLPSRWVESAIALSVVLVAINNLKPVFTHARWSIAFLFGLVHGFGFASVLSDLSLNDDLLILSLLGFNLGVEIGQSLILLLLFPAAYLLRKTVFYKTFILKGGSITISVLASFWLIQRLV